MKTNRETALSGIWAITWRSCIYAPVGFAVFLLFVCVVILLVIPPIIGTECLLLGLRWQGIALFAVWLPTIWAWRRFRLGRFFLES